MHWNLKIEQYGIIKRYGNSIVSSSLNRTKMWIGKYKFKQLLNIFVKYLDDLKWQIYIHCKRKRYHSISIYVLFKQSLLFWNFIHSINVNIVVILL